MDKWALSQEYPNPLHPNGVTTAAWAARGISPPPLAGDANDPRCVAAIREFDACMATMSPEEHERLFHEATTRAAKVLRQLRVFKRSSSPTSRS